MADESVRRALYVLFARLLAGPPDAALFLRLRTGGLQHLAEVQGVDLTSDLSNAEDAETSAAELREEYERLARDVSLRASDYPAAGAVDPVVSVRAFLSEHGLAMGDEFELPCDHISVAMGVMGELTGQADADPSEESRARARSFFLRHVAPWCQQALTEIAARAQRHYYRGLAAMVSAFLETERRAHQVA
ncbi:MAG: TorD/DmsD family molecular chaperone [Planctomycetota bacterium]|jgi:TorA maturation chaperone TorD